MATRLSSGASGAMLDALRTLVENGTLRIFSGTQPADPNSAITDTVLATITTMNFSAVTVSGNNIVISISATESDSGADATGTAGWYCLSDSSDALGASSTLITGEPRVTGTVTATGGGGDLQLVSTSITATQPVNITAFTITLPRI